MKKQKAYIKVTHDDPKKAREMAEMLADFAKELSKMFGENPDEVKILDKDPTND